MTASPYSPEQAEHFRARVCTDGPVPAHAPHLGPCWPWTGATNHFGYGNVCIGRRSLRSHRVAWMIANGPVPDGLCVLHRCDNPPCCNPAHLFLGTKADNAADMVAKDRVARGDRHFARLHPERLLRGEKHWSRSKPERVARGDRSGARKHPESVPRGEKHTFAKLTEVAVRAILSRLKAGESQRTIARKYGVSQSAVQLIATGKTWAHVARGE